MAKIKTIIVGVIMGVFGVTGVAVVSNNHTSPHLHSTSPGSIDPAATKKKICTVGYTSTIRPPESYTYALKVKQLKALKYKDQKTADYEEDHYIPLELGGNPTDPKNLWPELWADARVKDKEENSLHADVCNGRITLAQAQAKILADWK